MSQPRLPNGRFAPKPKLPVITRLLCPCDINSKVVVGVVIGDKVHYIIREFTEQYIRKEIYQAKGLGLIVKVLKDVEGVVYVYNHKTIYVDYDGVVYEVDLDAEHVYKYRDRKVFDKLMAPFIHGMVKFTFTVPKESKDVPLDAVEKQYGLKAASKEKVCKMLNKHKETVVTFMHPDGKFDNGAGPIQFIDGKPHDSTKGKSLNAMYNRFYCEKNYDEYHNGKLHIKAKERKFFSKEAIEDLIIHMAKDIEPYKINPHIWGYILDPKTKTLSSYN